MWALGFVRKGKIVGENANQLSCSDFFNWQIFSKVPPEKYGFLPYKVVVSFIIWLHSTILPILGETFANSYMKLVGPFWDLEWR
jgi:hypothetical protein